MDDLEHLIGVHAAVVQVRRDERADAMHPGLELEALGAEANQVHGLRWRDRGDAHRTGECQRIHQQNVAARDEDTSRGPDDLSDRVVRGHRA